MSKAFQVLEGGERVPSGYKETLKREREYPPVTRKYTKKSIITLSLLVRL